MGSIRILTEQVASQIAAGEVVERPASVVRELLDNSIDARAGRITVRMEAGGKRLIRVSDDGIGMERDDLLLCVERHATSKIKTTSDLAAVKTLGFRGEALPSIASVSRLMITSRPATQVVGFRLKVEGGRLKGIDETGTPAGTIIEVNNLFYNTPARKHFLKSTRTEAGHVVQTVSRMALPFVDVHFRLDEEGKTIINLAPCGDARDRLSAMLGGKIAAAMEEISDAGPQAVIKAYLAPPEMSRSRGDRILIYVNRRNIRDRSLTRAIMEGYGQRLMKGRYPQAVIFLEMDPSLVDQNVHPAKQEVRYQDQRSLYRRLASAVQRGLGGKYHVPWEGADSLERLRDAPRPEVQESFHMAEPVIAYSEEKPDIPFGEEDRTGEGDPTGRGMYIIGQLKNTYILCQSGDGLLMIDQHAAHERIVYETLQKSLKESRVEVQPFLIPYKVELTPGEGRVLEQGLGTLKEMGLEIEHFGGDTFLLRSVPAILLDARWEELIGDLVTLLDEEKDIGTEKALDRFLTITACHGAIRAGQRLSRSEMTLLIEQLEGTHLPTNCPHGRPVTKKISFFEIEKMFKRAV